MTRVLMEHVEEQVTDDNDATMEDNEGGSNNQQSSQPSLSKSWAQELEHAPSYSGGKVTLCHGRGTRNLYGFQEEPTLLDGNDDDDADDNNNEETNKETFEKKNLTPFLLAPCDGDLTVIDAIRGIKARTIREGCVTTTTKTTIGTGTKDGNNNNNDDDADFEDDALDADAILSYALAPNDIDLITASRNNILRQYSLSGGTTSLSSSNSNNHTSASYKGSDGTGPNILIKTIGRSGHELPITHIQFHTSGIFFATGSVDGNVKVWDLRGGYATHSFRYSGNRTGGDVFRGGGLRGSVSCLEWCPDVRKLWLGVGREDGSVQIHDLRKQQGGEDGGGGELELLDHAGAITCMKWTDKLDFFITAGRDSIVNTWSVREEEVAPNRAGGKKKKQRKNKDANAVHSKMVYKRIHTLPMYESVEGLQLLPNSLFISSSSSTTTHKHDILMATAGSKGKVRIWRAHGKEVVPEDDNSNLDKKGKVTSLTSFKCIAEQSETTSFGEDRGGYMGLLLTSHKQQLNKSRNTIGSADGGEIAIMEELIAIDAEHNMLFLNLKTTLGLNRTIVGHNDEILDLKILPESIEEKGNDEEKDFLTPSNMRKVAVATNSAQVRLFELGTFSCDVLEGHTDTVLCLDTSPCGRYLATCGKDQTMRLWDIHNQKCVAEATGHTEAVGATCLSRKIVRYDVSGKSATNGAGAFAVTASRDRTLKRWNLPGATVLDDIATGDGELLSLNTFCSVRAHEKDINIVTVAPNDSLIATGSQDKTVKIWDAIDLSLKGTLKGHKRGVWDCQFSSYDRVIATGSGDKTVKLWSLTDFSCVRTFQGHTSSALRVRFLSAGLQLISCDAEGIIKLWGIRSNECAFSIDAHTDKVWALDLLDGMLVSGGADSRLKVFRDTTIELEEQNREAEEQNILMEQKLANHLRFKEYEQALDIALDMDKPRQALKVLTAIVESDLSKGNQSLSSLHKHVKTWQMSRICQILKYCRDWNTRARNSHIAMLTVKAIFTTIPAEQLIKEDGLSGLLDGIAPYADRHFERVDKLISSSYLIDFTLQAMGDLGITEDDEYSKWEANCKLLSTPKTVDGKIQIGGQTKVGGAATGSESDSDVITIGESDSDSDSSSDSE